MSLRRTLTTGLLGFALALPLACGAEAADPTAPADLTELLSTKGDLVRLDGTPLPAADLDGKVVLFVNVASKCGYTGQYEGLQALYEKYQAKGLVIVGVPCNQFMGQEPGKPEEIASFCKQNYGVTFPLLEKQKVNGPERSDLYRTLVHSEAGGGDKIGWNFEKFLVGRDGKVLQRFATKVEPEAPELVAAIEGALGS